MNSKPDFETWGAGNSQTCLYTQDRPFAKFLLAEVGKWTTYDLNGRVYAWQFLMKTELVPLLVRKYSETHPLKNNDLQAAA